MKDKKTLRLSTYLFLNLGLINGLINALINYCVGFLLFRNLERIFVFGKSKSIIGDTFIMTFIVTCASILITLGIMNRHFKKFYFVFDVTGSKRISNFFFGTELLKNFWMKVIIAGIFLGSILSCLMAVMFLVLGIDSLSFQGILWYRMTFSFIVAFFVSVIAGSCRAMFLQGRE